MNYSRGSAGVTQAINRRFRAHPIAVPLMLLALGVALFALWLFMSDVSAGTKGVHVSRIFMVGASATAIILGLPMLLIGIGISVQRWRNKVVLRCPSCGLDARTSNRPFRVQRFNHVNYSMVTCPRCKWEFTVDKYAKLAEG